MAERRQATPPADLTRFELPADLSEEDRLDFARGITAFRAGDFYLAHDLWEEVWHSYRRKDRLFLQGLIHVAVGGYHAQCGNARGAQSQLTKAIDKMTPFGPNHWGLDVTCVLARAERARSDVMVGEDTRPSLRSLREGI